jgi:hypothetical protein
MSIRIPVEWARSLSGRAQTCGRQPRQAEWIANEMKPDSLSKEMTKQQQTPATTSPSESPNTLVCNDGLIEQIIVPDNPKPGPEDQITPGPKKMAKIVRSYLIS